MAEEIPERIARNEAYLATIGTAITEIKQLIVELGRRLDVQYAPRTELDQRFAGLEARVERVENRSTGLPPWISVVGAFLIGLVSLLGGALLTLLLKGVS